MKAPTLAWRPFARRLVEALRLAGILSWLVTAAGAVTTAQAATGVPAWQQRLESVEIPGSYETPFLTRELADGSVMVLMQRGVGLRAVRFGDAGAEISSVPVRPGLYVVLAAIDPFGKIFVAGVVNDDWYSGTHGDIWIMKYDGLSGSPEWVSPAVFDSPEAVQDAPKALFVDPRGDLIVTGFSVDVLRAFKYDGHTGALVWEQIVATDAHENVGGTAIDGAGNLLLSVERDSDFGSEALLFKLS